jgi:transcriptional regulator with GAF, ATPase, and Fis domain
MAVPSRVGLLTLAERAARIAPVSLSGVVQRQDDERTSIVCVYPHGIARGVARTTDVPHVLVPTPELREGNADGFDAGSKAWSEWLVAVAGVRRLASVPVQDRVPPTCYWVGSANAERFTGDQLSGLQAIVASGAALLDEPLSSDAAVDRLMRLEYASEALFPLLHLLDPQEVFERIAGSALKAVPHDAFVLRLMGDDRTEVRRFTRTYGLTDATSLSAPAYTFPMTRSWDFDIVDDGVADSLEGNGSAAEIRARSSLRLAVRFDEHLIGALEFLSLAPNGFTTVDASIGRRLADQVAVALAHHGLAEQISRAKALQERAANLEVLDGLLATLTGVLDVREVFDRVSAIAQKVLPHDAMSISELIDNGVKVRIHASHGLGQLREPFDMVLPEPRMAREPWDYRLLDDVQDHPEYSHGPGWAAGMRSMLFVSIGMEGRNWGGLNFYSRRVGHFVHGDVLVARRITDHVALALSHRRLADEARRNEELRARTTSLELLDDLLAALADTGDLREIFARISAVVRRVLDHQGAALIVRRADGARVYATSGFREPLPETTRVPEDFLGRSESEHHILDDLTRETAALYATLSGLDFRSLIRVPIQMDGRIAGALLLLATRTGAFKPTDVLVVRRMADRLAVALARDREIAASQRADEATARAARLEARVKTLTEELDARTGYRRVVGESLAWRHVLTQAAQVASTEATVLLLGESGTGKEVVARFLHRGSKRRSGPFIALNCAALPEQLLEAELFGYERGAYTGATQSKPGQLEQAGGGTLFLDEVAEMSSTAQPKFLRVLQEREFQRLGGTRVLRTDARIVAATNRDLKRSIANGQFREDLYYRLNVFAIRLPPLRERRDDILPLSEAFIAEIGRALGRPPSGISRDARQMLVEYEWPGNVRELRNVLERAAILCDGGLITADHLALEVAPVALRHAAPRLAVEPAGEPSAMSVPAGAPAGPDSPAASGGDLRSIERAMIEQALQRAKFNKSRAAKALGLSRHQLYIRMRNHGLE